mmetsp:Transcript_22306/g.51334  ORF Transcript_22306/g.51334 Transcript_22306/m.51334 type:complete len:309 (+) Transcript_22306:2475-3401(+)
MHQRVLALLIRRAQRLRDHGRRQPIQSREDDEARACLRAAKLTREQVHLVPHAVSLPLVHRLHPLHQVAFPCHVRHLLHDDIERPVEPDRLEEAHEQPVLRVREKLLDLLGAHALPVVPRPSLARRSARNDLNVTWEGEDPPVKLLAVQVAPDGLRVHLCFAIPPGGTPFTLHLEHDPAQRRVTCELRGSHVIALLLCSCGAAIENLAILLHRCGIDFEVDDRAMNRTVGRAPRRARLQVLQAARCGEEARDAHLHDVDTWVHLLIRARWIAVNLNGCDRFDRNGRAAILGGSMHGEPATTREDIKDP